MASVKFYLKDAKSKGETLIIMKLFYGAKVPIKYSIGLKALPSEWNDKKQRIREKRNVELFEDVNANLDRIENQALKTYLAMSNTNELFEVTNFKEQLKIDLGKKRDLTKFSFLEYIEKVIDDCDKPKEKAKLTDFFRYLKEFAQSIGLRLDFNSITPDIAIVFKSYLENRKTQFGSLMKKNTVATNIDILRKLISRAYKSGVHQSIYFQDKAFTAKYDTVIKEPLTIEELKDIFNVQFPDRNKRLARVRDIFVIGACTLMRYSDYSTLKLEDIRDGDFFKLTTKTKSLVKIPIHPMVTEILNRYEGKLPKNVDMRNFNRLIKEVAQVAGIDKPIVTAYVEGGIKKEDITPKWQTISTHSARKAGATILRNSGVRIEDIQMLLGLH